MKSGMLFYSVKTVENLILHSVSLRNFLNSWAHMGLTVKLMQFNDVYTVIKYSVHKILCVAILVYVCLGTISIMIY